ncbi:MULTISPECIES: DUF1310 family protein [unclassified Granulicatella]|uniref:DUF1310 family protein n=1 Tax=unclassified Granulicatella TaxID=2630493 RepID=UPI0010734080|nr:MULTISPECIES: DUF1310 family protein [unclassified Granulicatella]MBF0780366.1 DUF1310 family protein [Granulicatella sp. 19428wC4_WM01]TFU95498.1 DUF1310 family protein [Granulicatella sp. WM01]
MKKILALLGIVVLAIGGCSMIKNEPTKEEMIEVLKSREAIEVVEKSLKNLDDKALMDGGIIKSYVIEYDTVKWNPMGGISFKIYINEDYDLYINDLINKYNGKLENGSSSLSSKLSELLKGK